jgi:O-antigen ligase
MNDRPLQPASPILSFAFALLLALIFSLAFMQPSWRLLGFAATPTDLLFVPLALAWAAAVATGAAPFRWNRAYWLLAAYFASMLLSGLGDLQAALPKLASQAYLLSLPVLVDQLISREPKLRRAVLAWLAGTVVVAMVAMLSLGLFAIDPTHPLLNYVLFHFGTLPPGDYPRLRLTFLNANMLCNYLTMALCLALAARYLRWLSSVASGLLVAGILIAATFTISPGLAGIMLAIGLWLWLLWRERRRGLARLTLLAGIGAALLSVPAMALTPILHPTAPFLIPVPGSDLILAPAGRLMIWIDAVRNFLTDPILGRGIGEDAVLVRYQDPEGDLQRLTDAHNSFLSIAVQCGLVGVAALVAIVAYAARAARPLRLDRSNALRLALALAFLNGFAVQALGGSFEDARHLWVLFGLLLAAERIEPCDVPPARP